MYKVKKEGEVRRKQKNWGYQKEKEKNTGLKERTGGPALSGERGKQEEREENKILYMVEGEG